jgi:hypothetical protein
MKYNKQKVGLVGMGMVVGAGLTAVLHRGINPTTDWMLVLSFIGAWLLATDKP